MIRFDSLALVYGALLPQDGNGIWISSLSMGKTLHGFLRNGEFRRLFGYLKHNLRVNSCVIPVLAIGRRWIGSSIYRSEFCHDVHSWYLTDYNRVWLSSLMTLQACQARFPV